MSFRFSARADDPRRRAPRHPTDLDCDLGEVLDLSTGGMRVRSGGKPALALGMTGKIRLRIPEGSLSVRGRAVWIRRKGLRRYEVGIQFVDVPPKIATALDSIARYGFITGGSATKPPPSASAAPPVRASVEIPDYYGTLGIKEGARPEEIRSAYRALARKYHPDVSDAPDAAERFTEVLEAYEILYDPEKRKWYDMRRAC